MRINWYKVIGTSIMALNVFGKVSQANKNFEQFTGFGAKNIHPILGTVVGVGLYAQPVAKAIETKTNDYWLTSAKQQVEDPFLVVKDKTIETDLVFVDKYLLS